MSERYECNTFREMESSPMVFIPEQTKRGIEHDIDCMLDAFKRIPGVNDEMVCGAGMYMSIIAVVALHVGYDAGFVREKILSDNAKEYTRQMKELEEKFRKDMGWDE